MQGKVVITCNDYRLLVGTRPELLDNKHLHYNEAAPPDELDALRSVIQHYRPNHPELKNIEALIKMQETAQPPQD
jgi:hypothetical protein